MLYNVYINNGIAIKVTEYNQYCVPCNDNDSIKSSEKRVMKIELPQGFPTHGNKLETIKKYINLNNIL